MRDRPTVYYCMPFPQIFALATKNLILRHDLRGLCHLPAWEIVEAGSDVMRVDTSVEIKPQQAQLQTRAYAPCD